MTRFWKNFASWKPNSDQPIICTSILRTYNNKAVFALYVAISASILFLIGMMNLIF